ncbi:MAG: Co2+/Mg2+ efflux protein ApaG [Halomonadaceae bacterium]|uniref:Co2+/Mg2+ efflux protein ApaG n=1 Tax=Halomonas colorata TaxID=2742615 RepID=A0ABR9FV19_9GAMM|nr:MULTISPECIES: Co2+/Mg2+ efflux protein ApaG [Halomonas]MBE0462490.1 Co2+/Mg2+ efflux protein ApaG [Halomonas colorata]
MSGLAIEVSVTPEYCAAESSDVETRYVFSYTVTVHNQSPHSVQLMARYWKITQGGGDSQEVRGKGVVGQQPLIGPGQRFRYTSRAILQTPVGVMEGAYTLLNTYSQRAFEVSIAPFRLAVPRQLH